MFEHVVDKAILEEREKCGVLGDSQSEKDSWKWKAHTFKLELVSTEP